MAEKGYRDGMKLQLIAVAIATATVTATAGDTAAPLPSAAMPLGLPSIAGAKAALSQSLTVRHPEWIDVPGGAAPIRTFVVYPSRRDKAPVVLVTSTDPGTGDWVRAVGDRAAAEGFIALVPESGGAQPASVADALLRYSSHMPAATGVTATLAFQAIGRPGASLDVTVHSPTGGRTAHFGMTEHSWHSAMAFVAGSTAGSEPASAAQERGGRGRGGDGGALGGMTSKAPHLPANFLMAKTTIAHSPRRGEWIDIPVGTTKLRTWISHPQGAGKFPVVVVIHPGPGMDFGEPATPGAGANWMRAAADQLASEGFLALVPDFTSGLGPNGGNFDSFEFPDDVTRAMGKRTHAEQVALFTAARDYGLKLPEANEKSAAIGFCFGGGLAWSAAGEVPGLSAAVVFYGAPPNPAVMARIAAPVIAFFGENDLGLAPQIEPATAAMKQLGKPFDVHVYRNATHAFLYRQDLGDNLNATADAWPKAVEFLKTHTR
jgi:carboxymethylenebutenolidase